MQVFVDIRKHFPKMQVFVEMEKYLYNMQVFFEMGKYLQFLIQSRYTPLPPPGNNCYNAPRETT